MALTIDWSQHDGMSAAEQYEAAGRIIDEAKAAAAARRARIAHDLAQEHGAAEAAELLGISDKRVYQLAARYRESQPVIASRIPGRQVVSYDLLDDVTDLYGLGRAEAHDAIHAVLDDLVAHDGEDQVVIARTAVDPVLARHNPRDRDIYYWLTIREESAAEIQEALAVLYADRVA